MKVIDYDYLNRARSATLRMDRAHEILREYAPNDPPYLSNVYANLDQGSQTILIALAEQEQQQKRPGGTPFTWNLLVRRDEFGNIPAAGEYVERVIPINRKDREGAPVQSKIINAAMLDGSFSEKFEMRTKYLIDSKGCIQCTFSDAGYFLYNWGVHHKTNRGITTRPELSAEPYDTPEGKLHVWYWRYSEVDAEDYLKLPDRVVGLSRKRGGK